MITSLRLGHSALNNTLHLIGKHPIGLCDHCHTVDGGNATKQDATAVKLQEEENGPCRFIFSCYVFCYVFCVTFRLKCFVLVTCISFFIKYLVPGFNHRHLPGCPAFGSSPHTQL